LIPYSSPVAAPFVVSWPSIFAGCPMEAGVVIILPPALKAQLRKIMGQTIG
jgi:hypothetical protein